MQAGGNTAETERSRHLSGRMRTPVVLGDSPRRQGCLVTRIEPSSASTPRAQTHTAACPGTSMRLFLYSYLKKIICYFCHLCIFVSITPSIIPSVPSDLMSICISSGEVISCHSYQPDTQSSRIFLQKFPQKYLVVSEKGCNFALTFRRKGAAKSAKQYKTAAQRKKLLKFCQKFCQFKNWY